MFDSNYDLRNDRDYEYFDTCAQANRSVIERCRKVCELYGIKDDSKEFKAYAREMSRNMIAEAQIVEEETGMIWFGGYVVAFRNDVMKSFC